MKKRKSLIRALAVFLTLLIGAPHGGIAQGEGGDKTFKETAPGNIPSNVAK